MRKTISRRDAEHPAPERIGASPHGAGQAQRPPGASWAGYGPCGMGASGASFHRPSLPLCPSLPLFTRRPCHRSYFAAFAPVAVAPLCASSEPEGTNGRAAPQRLREGGRDILILVLPVHLVASTILSVQHSVLDIGYPVTPEHVAPSTACASAALVERPSDSICRRDRLDVATMNAMNREDQLDAEIQRLLPILRRAG